jgi:hypothetical protein
MPDVCPNPLKLSGAEPPLNELSLDHRPPQKVTAVPSVKHDLKAPSFPRRRDAFTSSSVSVRGLQPALDGRAAPLAGAILNRGYPIEHERSAIVALREWREVSTASGST